MNDWFKERANIWEIEERFKVVVEKICDLK